MTTNGYLQSILKAQNLADDSQELKDLRTRRKEVEELLRDKFEDSSPTIRYGGSVAKGTLIKEAYDLDLTCYFLNDDSAAGETLRDIYRNVRDALASKYSVTEKTSAIRLKSSDGIDFHVDVVPGRYVDTAKADVSLHQASGEKDWLKTNLDTHIEHIKGSGVVDAIRLLKLWKARRVLSVKTFVLELLAVDVLKAKKQSDLGVQLRHFWTTLKDSSEPMKVEDPANPTGNDLSALVTTVWPEITSAAAATLGLIEKSGWEAVYGPAPDSDDGDTTAKLRSAAAAVTRPSRPWLRRE